MWVIKYVHVAPEKINVPFLYSVHERTWEISRGGSLKPNISKESVKLNWNWNQGMNIIIITYLLFLLTREETAQAERS